MSWRLNESEGGTATPSFSQPLGQVSPKLAQVADSDDDGVNEVQREFDPLVVTRLGGTVPFNTDSVQLQCNETVTENNGDQNIRLVMECVATHTQLEELKKMRNSPDTIKLVSRAYTGPAVFDELKFDRVTDSNGSIDADGGNSDEPHYKVQLQSKETNNSQDE